MTGKYHPNKTGSGVGINVVEYEDMCGDNGHTKAWVTHPGSINGYVLE